MHNAESPTTIVMAVKRGAKAAIMIYAGIITKALLLDKRLVASRVHFIHVCNLSIYCM